MIDRNLINYPEQLVVRLTKLEREVSALKRELDKLKKGGK